MTRKKIQINVKPLISTTTYSVRISAGNSGTNSIVSEPHMWLALGKNFNMLQDFFVEIKSRITFYLSYASFSSYLIDPFK